MAEQTTDLKKEEKTSEPNPNPENNKKVSEDLQNSLNDLAAKVDKLLADGTPADKEIKVNKDKFDDRNEKAKLYETFAPVVDKLKDNPELVEKLLEVKEKGDLGERMSRLEEERKTEKRNEIRQAVTQALLNWPDLEKNWQEVKPLAESLAKGGVSYSDALRRAYFAVNPEAASAEKERVAREGVNRLGQFSTPISKSTNVAQIKSQSNLSEDDKKIAGILGKTPEEYESLLDKHKDWVRTNLRGIENLV